MPPYKTIILNASETLSSLMIAKEITNWQETLAYIKHLPYGRNSNRVDLSLVITEEKGTCSSKHALLKAIANENKIEAIQLILGMYKMNPNNTPGIGNFITESGLIYIPEAHCYLKINGERVDVTSPASSIAKIEKDILSEIEITPDQVAEWKVDYHKQFIRDWRISEGINMNFDGIWNLRENCISSLSNS